MSPPKVSLSNKESQKPIVTEEVLPERGDGVEFPTVITFETERRARNLRMLHKQRKCRRIVCGVTLVIIVAVAALATMALVLHFRRHHRKAWECRSNGLPVSVSVDHENQLIYAKHDHDQNSQTTAMEILHEYDRGLVAYKDVDNSTCYIDRLNETFEDGYERWQAYEAVENTDRKVLQVLQPIEIEVVEHITDIHIYSHCEKANSFWVKEIEITQVSKEMNVFYI